MIKNGQINKNKQNNKCNFESDGEEIINNNGELETENSSYHSNDQDDSSTDDTHKQTSSPKIDTKQDSSANKFNLSKLKTNTDIIFTDKNK